MILIFEKNVILIFEKIDKYARSGGAENVFLGHGEKGDGLPKI